MAYIDEIPVAEKKKKTNRDVGAESLLVGIDWHTAIHDSHLDGRCEVLGKALEFTRDLEGKLACMTHNEHADFPINGGDLL